MHRFRSRTLGSLSSHTYTNAANSSTITPRADSERVEVVCPYRRDNVHNTYLRELKGRLPKGLQSTDQERNAMEKDRTCLKGKCYPVGSATSERKSRAQFRVPLATPSSQLKLTCTAEGPIS